MLQGLSSNDRILVRMPSWLGDMVMAEPALGALMEAFGEARVSIAAPAHLLPVLDGLYPGARRIAHAGRAGEVARTWRGHALAILFTNSFRSAWVALRAGIPARVGWSRDARGWLLSVAPRPALERGQLPLGLGRRGRGRRYLARPFGATCIELLGRIGLGVARTQPRLVASSEGLRLADERLASLGLRPGEPFLLASVGSRPGSSKAFPAASWARTLDALAEASQQKVGEVEPLLLLVGPGEERCLDEILSLSRHRRLHAIRNPVAGLSELISLAQRASVALSADGGPRHVIAAAGTSLACVAGPSDPRHTADHMQRQRLLRVELPCGPCHRERCSESGEDERACMRRIDCEAFAHAAIALRGN